MTLHVLNCIMLMAFPFFFHTEHLDHDYETALSLAFIRFRIGPLEVIQATATSVAHSLRGADVEVGDAIEYFSNRVLLLKFHRVIG